MSAADRSISQRLRRAKSTDARRATLDDWCAQWRAEHDGLIRSLEQAVRARDFDRAASATGALKEMYRKRFEAITSVLAILIEGQQQ